MDLAKVFHVTAPILTTFLILYYFILRRSLTAFDESGEKHENENKDGFLASFARKNYGKFFLISSAALFVAGYIVRLIPWRPDLATAARLTVMYSEVIPLILGFLVIAITICTVRKTNIVWHFLFQFLLLSVGECLLGFSNWVIAAK